MIYFILLVISINCIVIHLEDNSEKLYVKLKSSENQ